jgi:predicted unusual protein kinase regulating ubiquinone biosynthesis (AarF/ABC1/UbiB family)
MSIESSRGRRSAHFVHATMHHDRRCDACGIALPRGSAARLRVVRRHVREILCEACCVENPAWVPSAGPPEPPRAEAGAIAAASLAAIPDVGGLPRGSIAVWIGVGVLGIAALLASRTGRRLLSTTGVAAKAAAWGVGARIGGDKNPGPAAVRRAFEDLGPTYVKLGQLVASSEGIFPEPYCQEFRKCLDRVRPFSYAEVEQTLRQELGRDPREVFDAIDEKPLASASIAQVHAARLRGGREVVIKVQRPKIAQIVEADLRVLRLAARALALAPHGELANPRGVVEDFASNIHEELDFRLEAANMAEFNRIMVAQGQVRVAAPRAFDDLSTQRVLVMERFFGHRIDDVEKLRESAVDIEDQLLTGMRAWFQCMLLHGFFHGDVHAGNLMALSDGRIGFLDFGIVGRFGRERRDQVADYLVAFATGDFAKLAEVMVAMGSIDRGKIDIARLSADLAASYEPILANEASPAKYADILPAILRTGVRHGMRMPRDFVLVVKQMLYFDRYAKLLAPQLNVFRDPRIVAGLMEDIANARTPLSSPDRGAGVAGASGASGATSGTSWGAGPLYFRPEVQSPGR